MLPVSVLAVGGVIFLSLFAISASGRASAGRNDFLPFYAGGRLALSGHLYDQQRVLAEERSAAGVAGESLHFIRPPWFAALLWPLARLPYLMAYRLWELLMVLAIAFFAIFWSPPGRVANLVALCFSVPALAALVNGQDTPLLLAWITLSALLARRGRWFAAGLALALCQTKFHLFLPLWIVLVAARQWRALAGLASGNAVLACVSAAVAGLRWPNEYLASIGRDAVTPGAEHMPTFFHAIAGLGPPDWWPLLAAALVACAAWAAGRRLDPETALLIAPALAMPFLNHTYVFDAVVLLPLLMRSLSASATAIRLTAVFLLTPIPWIGCFAGYPGTLPAAVTVLVLISTYIRLRTVPVAADEGYCTGGSTVVTKEAISVDGPFSCQPARR
ncbi:MAG: DUF2029 domain-containing protein [Acidobacteria bacterium]|nr:DUF2029 domain-containing protein [Acidobacteriota bacterium]